MYVNIRSYWAEGADCCGIEIGIGDDWEAMCWGGGWEDGWVLSVSGRWVDGGEFI